MTDVAQFAIEIKTDAIKEAQKGLEKLAETSKKTESATWSLKEAAEALAGAWAVNKIADAVTETTKLALRYEMLGATLTVMGANVGKFRWEMDAYQQTLEKTGISSLRARESLQVMAAAQLDLSKSHKLATVAQDAATLAGINSSEAFNKMVRGIATGETRIIRHMGVMVNFKSAIEQTAAAQGKHVRQFSSSELAQIRLNEVIKEGVKRAGVYEAAMTTAGKQLLSMERYVENLKVRLGDTFAPGMNDVVFAFVGHLKDANEALTAFEESGQKAQFMSTVRHALSGTADAAVGATKFLWQHRDAVLMLASAYGALKLGQYVGAQYEVISASVRSTMAIAANRTKVLEAAVASIAAKKAEAAAEVQRVSTENAARITEARGRFLKKAEYVEMAVAKTAADRQMMASTRALMLAEKELEVSRTIGGKGAAFFSSAITAMGGPIGALIALLGVATAAYMLFGKAGKDVGGEMRQSVQDKIKDDLREIQKNNEVMRRLLGGETPDDARHKTFDPWRDDHVLRNANNEWHSDAAKFLDKPSADGGEMSGLSARQEAVRRKLADAQLRLSGMQDVDSIRAENSYIEKQEFELQKINTLVSRRNELLQLGAAEVEKENTSYEMQKKLMEAAKKVQNDIKDGPDGGGANDGRRRFLDQQADLLAKIAKAQAEANYVELDPRRVEYLKIQADLTEAISKHHNKNAGSKQTMDEAHIKRLIQLEKELAGTRRAALDAKFRREDDEARRKQQLKDLEEAVGLVDKVRAANDAWGKTEDELAAIRMRNIVLDGDVTQSKQFYIHVLGQELERKRELQELDARAGRFKPFVERGDDGNALVNTLKDIQAFRDKNPGVLIPVQAIQDALKSALQTQLKFAAESGSIWGIVGYNISQGASKGTDALTEWMNKTNGMARTWKTFGDTFRDVLHDMVVQMQKMVIQQQLMEPLMNGFGAAFGSFGKSGGEGFWAAFSKGWNGGKADGGSVAGGAWGVVGERGPELFKPAISGTIIPNHRIGGQSSGDVHFHFYENGAQKTSGTPSAGQLNLKNMIAPIVRQVIQEDSAQGSSMNPLFPRR